MGVEQLAAKRAVKALDIGVLCWFAPMQGNILLFTPSAHTGTDKFGSVISVQLREVTMMLN